MTRLNTLTQGQGEQRIVFLHGLFGQGRNFSQVAKALSADATSLLVDLPNHGGSEWTEVIDFDEMADAVANEIGSFAGADGVCLVGHSLGGKVAMRCALRHPEQVERLLVADMSPVASGLGAEFTHLTSSMQAMDLSVIENRSDADAMLAEQVDDLRVRGFLLQNLRRAEGGWQWQMNLDLLSNSLEELGDWPPIDATYDGPVLWLAGEYSDYIRDEYSPAMRELFPRTVLVTLKDAGHWVHSEQPAAFATTLRRFLSTD